MDEDMEGTLGEGGRKSEDWCCWKAMDGGSSEQGSGIERMKERGPGGGLGRNQRHRGRLEWQRYKRPRASGKTEKTPGGKGRNFEKKRVQGILKYSGEPPTQRPSKLRMGEKGQRKKKGGDTSRRVLVEEQHGKIS